MARLPDEDRKIIRLRSYCFVLFFAFGVVGFIAWYLYDPFLDYYNYRFDIDMNTANSQEIHNFQMYYDFTKQTGNISFELTASNYTDFIRLNTPNQLNIVKVIWRERCNAADTCNEYENNTDYREQMGSDYNGNYVTLSTLHKEKKEYTTIIIFELDGEIYPNADFMISFSTGDITAPKGMENGAFFLYNIADNYQCLNQPCEKAYRNNFDFDSRFNLRRIKVEKEGAGWEKISNPIMFGLNYNIKKQGFLYWLMWACIELVLISFIPMFEFCVHMRIKYNNNHKEKSFKNQITFYYNNLWKELKFR